MSDFGLPPVGGSTGGEFDLSPKEPDSPPDSRILGAAAAVVWPFHFIRRILYGGTEQKFRQTVNFTGAGVVVSDTGSQLDVTIAGGGGSAYNLVQDEGIALTARTTMNFAGAGVTATDSAGVTLVTIPGGGGSAYNLVQDEGVGLTARTTLNFTGTGVTASDSGAVTTVAIPTPQAYATVQDEGSPLTQRTTMNFVGAGVVATDSGAVTTVTIAGGGGAATIQGGSVVLDFGAAPGTNTATATVTTALASSYSTIMLNMMADATGDHNAEEHKYLGKEIAFTASNITGTSFDVIAETDLRLSGKITARWTILGSGDWILGSSVNSVLGKTTVLA